MTRRMGSLLVGGALVGASVLLTGGGTAGGVDADCPSPYAPLAYAQAYPAQEELPAVDGTDVARPWRPEDEPVDTDGDGSADTISVTGAGTPTARLVLGRGDGQLALEVPDAEGVGVYRTGDIDRDGRDEATVLLFDGSDAGAGTYLLPGTTPAGAATLEDAAIRLSPTATTTAMAPDASDRLLITPLTSPRPGATTVVHDGGDVLALGAGADATAVAPEATYPGRLTAVTATPATGAAVTTLVTATVILGPPEVGGTEEVRLVVVEGDGEVSELTTLPEPVASADPGPGIGVIVGEDGTFVVLGMASRSGASQHLWWLDDPCGPLPAADDTTPDDDPPPAVPADPVATDARFTG